MIKFGHINIGVIADDVSIDQFRWKDKEQCYQQMSGMDSYYNESNSSIWQMFDSDCPDFVSEVASRLPTHSDSHDNHVKYISAIKLDPGNAIPLHVDKHFLLRKRWPDMDCPSTRYLVFLEDWESGHYFEMAKSVPYTKWKKGDWISFGQDDWHLAGNMGIVPFITMQLTVFDE